MNKKWFLALTGTVLSAMMLTGCNGDQEPPPEEEPNVEQAPQDEGMNGTNGNVDNDGDINDNDGDVTPENDMAPGVDENDTMNQDDENDAQPDPEDAIEDPQDITDENNKDQ